eukprot:EG_transcript_19241
MAEGDTPQSDEMMELCFHTCFGDDAHVPYVPKSIPLCDRHALEVEQDEYGGGGVGTFVSPSAVHLARALHRHSEADPLQKAVRGCRTVVELGAGTGVLGLAAALLDGVGPAAQFVLTEQAPLLRLLQRNIERNRPALSPHCARVDARELDWGTAQASALVASLGAGVDLVLAADCVYAEEAIPPLVETLRVLCETPATHLVLSNKHRSRHTSELFFKLLRSDFDWEELAVPAVEGQADFFMLLAHRRPPQ